MDQATLDRLRAELQADRATQVHLLEEHGADPYSDLVTDIGIEDQSGADAGQATEERAELLGQLELARQRVQAIDHALGRMEEGTYGTCAVCGEVIPHERLEVRPLSVRCVRCAEAA
ncbi:TraR/DksA family transcriptional regulator [Nitriliruptor alkaliphilus]|uniref:TraR/DksA family transcriptional regulator n=1 Tax=Nitriliruptor alkaliphilus TaxID=427918 RepID=UPI000696E045|nr:TraR/DksA C4-type zinc finger protein [Nitriliruptor alkaliphilus]